jgi:hypothetical protein
MWVTHAMAIYVSAKHYGQQKWLKHFNCEYGNRTSEVTRHLTLVWNTNLKKVYITPHAYLTTHKLESRKAETISTYVGVKLVCPDGVA